MSVTLELLAPLSGLVIPLSAVPDPVFSGLMMGDGLAIEPLSSLLCAPCDGVVSQIARTGHALTLTADNGAEILMHIGIDTVRLGGVGFTSRVAQGDRVKKGDALIEVDFDAIADKVPSLNTVIVIANGDNYRIAFRAEGEVEAGSSAFLSVSSLAAAAAATAAAGPELSASAKVRHAGGLHARPSALVQNTAKRFKSAVQIEFNGQRANAKSVVALMGLGVGEDDEVTAHVSGADAEDALAAVIEILQTRTESEAAANAQSAAPAAAPVVELGGSLIGGVCAAPGLAIGQVVEMSATELEVAETAADEVKESKHLQHALDAVRAAIDEQVRDARSRKAQHESEIFTAHLALLDDPELIEAAQQGIHEGKSAGFAFRRAVRTQCDVLNGLGNALLAERVTDLRDLERRVLIQLTGGAVPQPKLFDASILVADDLTPSELTSLPRERIAGLATARGGATSHVAILARAMGVPALVAGGARILELKNGQEVLLDTRAGWLDAAPDSAKLDEARTTIAAQRARQAEMLESAAGAAHTLDGVHIEVACNIGSVAEAREGLSQGADAVGLTRTEFLFIERTDAPTQAQQLENYQGIVDAMQGRPAIIRTIDVGGDKEVPYLTLPPEENPALGLRGIRTGFAMPELLDTQLRALLQVKPLSKLRILIPMVADVSDLLRVRQRIEELATEMGIAERPELGVMIEVPSAAVLADQLAEHADFMSVGTNDLTQYTLAMDRVHPGLASRIDAMHPGLLRLIALAVEGANRHGKWVGVCGALASDPDAAPVLVGLGVTELSVSPGLVPEIKTKVRGLNAEECRREALEILKLTSAADVRARARALWPAA
jgi:phosphoenolpyruvate-protein phosphotransferase